MGRYHSCSQEKIIRTPQVTSQKEMLPYVGIAELTGKQLGNFGERIAQKFLQDKAWHICDTNWSCSLGEIDIVAQNDLGELVFIEVKTTSRYAYSFPEEAVTFKKQQRYAALAQCYLQAYPYKFQDRLIRFDVVGVCIDNQDQVQLHHIPYAFSCDGESTC